MVVDPGWRSSRRDKGAGTLGRRKMADEFTIGKVSRQDRNVAFTLVENVQDISSGESPHGLDAPEKAAIGLRAGRRNIEHDLVGIVEKGIIVNMLADDGRGNATKREVEDCLRIVGVEAQSGRAKRHVGDAVAWHHFSDVESARRDGRRRRIIAREQVPRHDPGRSVIGAGWILEPPDRPVVTATRAGLVEDFDVVALAGNQG